jgi:ISXO2-like transposase domain
VRSLHHQASVTAGTVMHGTRTPLRLWFWAAYLVATHTPGISAKQLQRQLGLSRYETAWLMLQKLRRAVAPERTPLRGEVEVDEGFVGGVDPRRRAGRARIGKRLVAVAVEVRGQGSGRLRLAALPGASGASLGGFITPTSSREASSTPTAGAATPAHPRSASTTGRSLSAGATPRNVR